MSNKTTLTFNKFKSLILENLKRIIPEASTTWSTNFEQVICDSWNIWRKVPARQTAKIPKNGLAGYTNREILSNTGGKEDALSLSYNIYDSISQSNLLDDNAELVKLPNQSDSVTGLWKAIGLYDIIRGERHMSSNTPKTDICVRSDINKSNPTYARFSVKANVGNQLMSGGINETLATIIVSIVKAYPSDTDKLEAFSELIEEYLGIKYNLSLISRMINNNALTSMSIDKIIKMPTVDKKLSTDKDEKLWGTVRVHKSLFGDNDIEDNILAKVPTKGRKHFNRANSILNGRARIKGVPKDYLNDTVPAGLDTDTYSRMKADVMRLKQNQGILNDLLNKLLKDDSIKYQFYYEAASGMVKFGNSVSTATHVLVWNNSGECTIDTVKGYLNKNSSLYTTGARFKSNSNSASKKTGGNLRDITNVVSITGGKHKE